MSASILAARRPSSMQRLVRSSSTATTARHMRFPHRQYHGGRREALIFRRPPNVGIVFAGTALTGCLTAATFITLNLYTSCMPRICSMTTLNYNDVDDKVDDSTVLACSSSTVVLHDDELRYVQRLVIWVQDWIKCLWDIVLVSARSAEIALRLSPLAILTPLAILAEKFRTEEKSINCMSELSWAYAISAIQGLGPVAVKLCQWAGTNFCFGLFCYLYVCFRTTQSLRDDIF